MKKKKYKSSGRKKEKNEKECKGETSAKYRKEKHHKK
jgi:hypothetical protein